MSKTLSWHDAAVPAPSGAWRRPAARLLRLAGRGLAAWARRLAPASHAQPAHDPVLEFYAEAGAPEGALYVDGRRIGVLPGVTRL
ncbi:MAG: hypothetical protein ABIX12_15645 [Rubrivivax sp.]